MPEPIQCLRAICHAAETAQPIPAEAAAWIVTTVRRYEAEAPLGITLDVAGGLTRRGNSGP